MLEKNSITQRTSHVQPTDVHRGKYEIYWRLYSNIPNFSIT